LYHLCNFPVFVSMVSIRGVQEPEYRSRLRQELACFSRSRSRTRSGYFWLEQDPVPEQERFF